MDFTLEMMQSFFASVAPLELGSNFFEMGNK